ncbi:MAG: barstar family protein [Pyrinomonadaceae bacterium]
MARICGVDGYRAVTLFLSIKSWDALSDSLWEGLWALSADRILIIWPHSDRMFDSPEDFEMAVNVVQDVVTTLADPDAANGRPNEVNVLIS